jgi:hypothetical protein
MPGSSALRPLLALLSRLAGHGLVDGHFAGRTSALGERRLWRHLPRCGRCRERYRAHALIESMDPQGEAQARARLGRLLFAADTRRVGRGVLAGAWMAAAVAGLALVVWLRPQGEPAGVADHGYTARGAGVAGAEGAPGPALTLYQVGAAGGLRRAGAVVQAADGLAFAYSNPEAADRPAARFLMVLAHDGGGRVFWYWPAWTDPAAPPRALPIAATAAGQITELGEAVRQPLAPGRLTVMGLFCGRELDVLTVEAALAGGPRALQALEDLGCRIWREPVEVVP